MKNLLSPIFRLKEFVSDASIISSDKVFAQSRAFMFRVFKNNYNRYKYWIEPKGESGLPIDVIIPVIAKDLEILPYVIEGVRKHVKHPVKNIYIVAPNQEAIRLCAQNASCVFINETTLCDIAKNDIGFVINGNNRNGWIYQQLLKFNFDKVGTCNDYLVVDADTVFVKDTCFEYGGKTYFDFSNEYHQPYYKAYEILTGLKHSIAVSFVSHYMLFNKPMLGRLKKDIEKHYGLKAERAIIKLKDAVNDISYFSEYETYANYCISKAPQNHRIRFWFNGSLPQSQHVSLSQVKQDNKVFKTLSFHAYNVD